MVKFITLKHELMDEFIFEQEEDQAEFEQAQPIPTPVMPTPMPTPVPDSIFQEEDQVELGSVVEPDVAVGAGAGDSTTDSNCEQIIDSIQKNGGLSCNATNGPAYCTILPGGCKDTIKSKCDYDCNTAPSPAPPSPGPGPTGGLPCGDIDNTNIVWTGLDPITNCNVNQCKDKDCNDCNNSYSTTTGHPCWGDTVGETCKTHDHKYEQEWLEKNCSGEPTPGPTPTGPAPSPGPTPPAPTPTDPTPAPTPTGPGGTGNDSVCQVIYDGNKISIYHHTDGKAPGADEACSYYNKINSDCDNNYIFIQAWWILQLLSQSNHSDKAKAFQGDDIGGKKFKLFSKNFTKAAQDTLQDYYVGQETFTDEQFQNWPSKNDNPYLILNCTSGLSSDGECQLDGGTTNYIKRYVNNMMREDPLLPEKNGDLYVVNDQFMQNYFLKSDNVTSCQWNNVSPVPTPPTPPPNPTPPNPTPPVEQGDNPCFNGDCGETLCKDIFTGPARNSIKDWPPKKPDTDTDRLNTSLKQYCKTNNNYNLFKLKDSSKCDSLDISTNTKLQDKLKYCFSNVSQKDQDSPEEKNILYMKNCSCIDDFNSDTNDLPNLYDLSNSSSKNILRNKEQTRDHITSFNKTTDLAFWLENKSVEFKNCIESTAYENPSKCVRCGVQYFNDDPGSFAKETTSSRYIEITSDIVDGDSIKSCCPGFKEVCLDKYGNLSPSSGKCKGANKKICVYDNTDATNKYTNNYTDPKAIYTSTNKYNILTAGDKPPDTPTPQPTASLFNFTISKSSYDTKAGCQEQEKRGQDVKIKTSSPSPDEIKFSDLENQGTNCCIKQVSKTSDPKKKFIVGRNIAKDDTGFCDTKVCNTNFIIPDNSDDIVVRTADDTNNIYFYDSNPNQFKENILIQDPHMCCKNFGLYQVKNEQTIKDMIGIKNKEKRIKNLNKIYDSIEQYFTGKAITSFDRDKGLCLYIGDNNRDKSLVGNWLPDQSTWNSGSVTPTPANCNATPGPCVINLVHQFGGRWWDYFQNNPLPNQAFDGLPSNVINNIKQLYLTDLINKVLKPIDDLITKISKNGQSANICTNDCYCSLDVSKISSSLKLLPSINNKSNKTNNIFSIHKKGMIKKNITSKKILDTQATPGMLGAGESINLTEYVVITESGNNPDKVPDTTVYTKITLKDSDKETAQKVLKYINNYIMGNNYYFNIDYNQSINLDSDGNPNGDYDTIWIRQGKNCADKDEGSASQKNNSCAKGSYYDSNAPKCDTFSSKNNCNWINKKADTINTHYDSQTGVSYSNVPVLIKEVCTNFTTPAPAPAPCPKPGDGDCKKEDTTCTTSTSCSTGGCCSGLTCKNKEGVAGVVQTVCVKNS